MYLYIYVSSLKKKYIYMNVVNIYIYIHRHLSFSVANLAQVISQSGTVPPATPFGRTGWYNTATDLRAIFAPWHRPPSDYIII